MVWSCVYGCNMHRGAEGDNSTGQFGTLRKPCRLQGNATKKWKAVVRHTPANPRLAALEAAGTWPLTKREERKSTQVIHASCKERDCDGKALWNVKTCPELEIMHELSRGKLPSKRLRFHFPDLFPEVMEQEKSAAARIFYQEPPRLVNTESLLRWMVPSVPWRYLQNRYPATPLVFQKEAQTAPLHTLPTDLEKGECPRGRNRVSPVIQNRPILADIGCQTVLDTGTQTEIVEKHSHRQAVHTKTTENAFGVKKLSSVPVPTSQMHTQTDSLAEKVQLFPHRARKRVKKKKGNRGMRNLLKTRALAMDRQIRPVALCSSTSAERNKITLPMQQEKIKHLNAARALDDEDGSIDEAKIEQKSRSESSMPLDGLLQRQDVSRSVSHHDSSKKKQNLAARKDRVSLKPRATRDGKDHQKCVHSASVYRSLGTNNDDEEHKQQKTKKIKRHSASKPSSYLLKISPQKVHKGQTADSGFLCPGKSTSKSEDKTRTKTAPDDVESLGSSLESLEELERLIEKQHAQLVAKGFGKFFLPCFITRLHRCRILTPGFYRG